MPYTAEYYFKRADEVDLAACTVANPQLREAYQQLGTALRTMANFVAKAQEAKLMPPEKDENNVLKEH